MVMVALPQVSLAVGASKAQLLVHSTILSGTQMIVGLVVSTTVTFWLQSAVLPQASVARQVRVASKVLPHRPVLLVTELTMMSFTLPQGSLAVCAPNDQATLHSKGFACTHRIVG